MSAKEEIASSMGGVRVDGSAKEEDWSRYMPKSVGKEDALGSKEIKERWEKLYAAVGKASANEVTKKSIRCAVYAYALINGTSRAGNYSRAVTTSEGFEFPAAKVVAAVGVTSLRQFFRGCMTESYNF